MMWSRNSGSHAEGVALDILLRLLGYKEVIDTFLGPFCSAHYLLRTLTVYPFRLLAVERKQAKPNVDSIETKIKLDLQVQRNVPLFVSQSSFTFLVLAFSSLVCFVRSGSFRRH